MPKDRTCRPWVFVIEAIRRHFVSAGYAPFPHGHVDFAGRRASTGETRVIEAKGETSAVGLDFNTGLGQLLTCMTLQGARYALAVPATPRYLGQCAKVPSLVRERLDLHLILVRRDGALALIGPSQPVPT